jgi:hypothetical protein
MKSKFLDTFFENLEGWLQNKSKRRLEDSSSNESCSNKKIFINQNHPAVSSTDYTVSAYPFKIKQNESPLA